MLGRYDVAVHMKNEQAVDLLRNICYLSPRQKKCNFLLLMGKYLNYINNNVYNAYNKIKKICM